MHLYKILKTFQMKGSFITCAFGCFLLLGVGVYHYLLLSPRAPFALPSFQPNPSHQQEFISLEEWVKGPLLQNDPRILRYILGNNYLRPPSTNPYNLSHPKVEDPSMGQSKLVKRALKHMRNGFFVECGALDGELRSNSLVFEKHYGWNGLLIEGDPKNVELLLEKNRKAWISNSCLATRPYPHQVMFEQRFNRGRIWSSEGSKDEKEDSRGESPKELVSVQCFPLFSLLSALNVSTVDYFSLDVEGAELDVLKTIPFNQVYIKVLSVEYVHDVGGREAVKKFMSSKGYQVYGEVTDPRNWANDLIFVHNRIYSLSS